MGYRWVGEAVPGGTLELQLAWQAVGPQEPAPSFATRLWDAGGGLLSAADRALGAGTQPDEVRFTLLTHQLPIDRCTPSVTPTVGTYAVTDGGFEDLGSVSLPPIEATCGYPKLPTERPWPGFALVKGPRLRGVDYDTRADGSMTAYLQWCGPGGALVVSEWRGPGDG